MRKRTLWLGLSFLLVAALILTGCPAEVEEEPVVEEPVVEEPVVEEPQYGGTLTVATAPTVLYNCRAWDPHLGGFYLTAGYVNPYLEGLMGADVRKGMTGTGEHRFDGRWVPTEFMRGILAESWEYLTDPLRLVFHIRPGIYWQGMPGVMETRELTADDVVFTLERRMYEPRSWLLSSEALWDFVDTITATDRYTVTLELNFVMPEPDMIFQLGYGTACNIVPPELVEADIDDWHTHVGIGTGPFLLSDYVDGSLAEFTRNPNYWDTTIIDGKEYQFPFVDKLVWPVIPDVATQLASLRTGKLDIWEQTTWEYKDTLAATSPELRVWESDAEGAFEASVRHDTPPFDDIRVRQAMSMAIDRQGMIDLLYGGYGIEYNFIHPRAWPDNVFTKMEDRPAEVRQYYEYNPEGARELLEEALGPPDADGVYLYTSMNCPSIPAIVAQVSLIKDYWADIGIEVELIVNDPSTDWGIIMDKLHPHIAKMNSGGAYPAHHMYSSWYSGTEYNMSIYADPIFDDLLDRYSREPDVDKQNAIMVEMTDVLIEDVATIWVPEPNTFRFAWPWVRNYEGEKNTFYCSSVGIYAIAWIDQVMKADMGF